MNVEPQVVAARIDAVLAGDSRKLVAAYFDAASTFAGSMFDSLGENPPRHITSDDLLAVSLLDISFTPRAVRRLLQDDTHEIPDYLASIEPSERIWSAPEELLKGPANDLWQFLRKRVGLGPVTAGKLMARKRPHLIPIFDRVVRVQFGMKAGEDHFWLSVRQALLDDDRRARLEALRPGGMTEVSVLRLLDSLLWMNGSQSKAAKEVRLELGLKVQIPLVQSNLR